VPPPRALSPAGVVLVDKEPGPSSFAVVRRLRNRTGARAGHAGTLDPFASGLLLVFLGAATKLVGRFVGLDKRYLAAVDLGAMSTTGDPEGELTTCDSPDADELERRLDGLRGEVELPVPAYSAVKIGGRRAYKLARGGTVVEMPVRRSVVRSLDLLDFDGRVARLDLLVSSGTYVRSIASALGGHCAALRRTEVGPFGVDEADEERIVPAADALARLA
jgi:tRNA pseudouridine55 synthase